MNKYIKLEDAINDLDNLRNYSFADDIKTPTALKQVRVDLLNLPTIDIVHCKDCTFAKPTKTENVIQCTWLSGYTFRIDHYCSAGERKGNE